MPFALEMGILEEWKDVEAPVALYLNRDWKEPGGSCRGGGKARGEAKRKKWYFQLIRRVRRLRKRLLRDLETVRRNGSDYRRDRWCDRKCLIFAVRGNSSAAMIKRQIR
jgi:hypothetical protein